MYYVMYVHVCWLCKRLCNNLCEQLFTINLHNSSIQVRIFRAIIYTREVTMMIRPCKLVTQHNVADILYLTQCPELFEFYFGNSKYQTVILKVVL